MKWRKYFERRLDRGRAARVYHEFECTRGYAAYHAFCQQAWARERPPTPDRGLVHDGYMALDAMSPAAAAGLLERCRRGATPEYLKKDTRNLRGFRVRDEELAEALAAAALSPAVDAAIAGWFGAEYLVHWLTVSETPPGSAPASVSFRWHCDRGPRQHLKLIVYLNDGSEHGGGTAFLARADSLAVAASGYLFGRAKRRTYAVDGLAEYAGRPVTPWQPPTGAGAAVLFEPSTIVHVGIMPTRAPRYALTLCLLPSPLPWREALARGTRSDLMDEDLWHGHAAELLERLAMPEDAARLRGAA
ncbi:MAG: hypothetical protein H6977_07545 [Gammaproteobacteria bacterium]|nr:hypothetical protein [Gammaproteobacteria bacterium]MCP5199849.1 hypothetical protein [Gammaproteobacteria bacterium]